LGGDSVLAMQLLGQIKDAFGISLDSKLVFEEFTVERIASLVAKADSRATAHNQGEVPI
jgi:acyl carrier protein